MKEKIGEVFSIGRDNPSIPGCTISKEIYGGENSITYFSLAKNTDISAEIYPYHKLLIVAEGSLEVYGKDNFLQRLQVGESILTLTNTPYGNENCRRQCIYRGICKKGEYYERKN